jgi:hypothetical protein
MKLPKFTPVACAEILDGGVVLTFYGGKSSFLSAALLHEAARRADELPEFFGAEQKVRISKVPNR